MASNPPIPPMRKAYYYQFIPTKAQEEAIAAGKMSSRATRTLIEVRDTCIHQVAHNHNNPWLHIKKTINGGDIYFGKINLSDDEMLELLRHCAISKGNSIISGGQSFVLYDNTDAEQVKYTVSVDIGAQDGFTLGCVDLIRKRNLGAGDVVGLCWDYKEDVFRFKLLSGANNGGK